MISCILNKIIQHSIWKFKIIWLFSTIKIFFVYLHKFLIRNLNVLTNEPTPYFWNVNAVQNKSTWHKIYRVLFTIYSFRISEECCFNHCKFIFCHFCNHSANVIFNFRCCKRFLIIAVTSGNTGNGFTLLEIGVICIADGLISEKESSFLQEMPRYRQTDNPTPLWVHWLWW